MTWQRNHRSKKNNLTMIVGLTYQSVLLDLLLSISSNTKNLNGVVVTTRLEAVVKTNLQKNSAKSPLIFSIWTKWMKDVCIYSTWWGQTYHLTDCLKKSVVLTQLCTRTPIFIQQNRDIMYWQSCTSISMYRHLASSPDRWLYAEVSPRNTQRIKIS